jgi:hypothetical protein
METGGTLSNVWDQDVGAESALAEDSQGQRQLPGFSAKKR